MGRPGRGERDGRDTMRERKEREWQESGGHDFLPRMTRRRFVQYAGVAGVAASVGTARFTRAEGTKPRLIETLDASTGPIDLRIAKTPVHVGGRRGEAVTINGGIPGPLLRFREGGEVEIRVHNALDEDTSIHWHGILVPNGMDGVPKVNFPGIRPGETFSYRYRVRQYGTYWYHSHSAFQEQLGHYGPLVIEPRTYSLAAAVVLASASVSGLIVRHKLDHLDLVEVLKTRE